MKAFRSINLLSLFTLFFVSQSMGQSGWFWQNPTPQGNTLRGGVVFGENTALVVGERGTVIKTSDGGKEWEIRHYAGGTEDRLRSVSFIDANNGWAVGSNHAVIRTRDGGSSWLPEEFGADHDLFAVYFPDADNGWIVGADGRIFYTNDGGSHWTPQISGSGWLTSVYFTDASTGWAAGEDGVILKTTTGGLVSINEEQRDILTLPQTAVLLQNYPNPFNSTTIIRYRLPKSTPVVLKIYNLLGQPVRTLVNERQNVGEWSVVWDGRDRFGKEVSSGIYIYRIRAGDYVKSHKMVFIK